MIKQQRLFNQDNEYIKLDRFPDFGIKDKQAKIINLEILKSSHTKCDRCDIAAFRKCAVFSSGNKDSPLVLVGEALGKEENSSKNVSKSPFIGKAGDLLNRTLHKYGLNRKSVYVTNTVKDWPPGNRVPTRQEIINCFPFLSEEISLYPRKLIVALGVTAALALTKFKSLSIKQSRNKEWHFNRIPLLITYHPAGVLRNPIYKDEFETAIKIAKEKSGL